MRCPFCDFEDSKVIDSRTVDSAVRRRRQCLRCGLRYTTLERVQGAVLTLIKGDGRRELFNRSKLASGIHKACAKRPLPLGSIEKMVDEIEEELQKLGKAEVPTGHHRRNGDGSAERLGPRGLHQVRKRLPRL